MEIYGYVGEMGSGKTHFALQKIKELKSDGKTVLMISWADPIKSIFSHAGLLKSGRSDPSEKSYEVFNKSTPADFINNIQIAILEIIEELDLDLPEADYTRFLEAIEKHRIELTKIHSDLSKPECYSDAYRKLMQIVGTDLGRCLYDSIWIDITLVIINLAFSLNIASCAIIDDIRFQNEYDAYLKFGKAHNYKSIIYGVNSDINTRAKRLNSSTQKLEDFQTHDSEKYISKLILDIPAEHIIKN